MSIKIGYDPDLYSFPYYESPGYTILQFSKVADGDGTLIIFKVLFLTDATGVKVGTFYTSGAPGTCISRDHEVLGNVSSGSTQTFSGLDCDCMTDDLFGFYCASGSLGYGIGSSEIGVFYLGGDMFDGMQHSYNGLATPFEAMYGESDGAVAPNAPTTPSPVNAGTGKAEDQFISCVVTDPSDLPMDVSFYDGDDNLIGTVENVASGGIAKILWEGLTPSTSYTWYAVADNGSATAQSANWTFTAGSKGGFWFLSTSLTYRQYISGLKILHFSSTLLNFIKKIKITGGIQSSDGSDGATGTFTDKNDQVVTVKDGIITDIT